jgi:alkaline phosphatase
MKLRNLLIIVITLFQLTEIGAQTNIDYNEQVKNEALPVYTVQNIQLPYIREGKKPKNIILLIGDGMGIAQVQAAMDSNNGLLYMSFFKNIGFSKTQSANNYITDSAAGGTAIACGVKTNNGMIGVRPDSTHVTSILEIAETLGKSTGLVSTSSITHATPASFIAHQPSRKLDDDIAADFLNVDFEVIIGGGYNFFAQRNDGRNLIDELLEKGYRVEREVPAVNKVQAEKLAVFVADEHAKPYDERGEMLVDATKTALSVLSQNKKGFFVMVEGSQIDWGGHANNQNYMIGETMDFDKAVGVALAFAASDKNTLVIVTADHETGGAALNGGKLNGNNPDIAFTSKNHTAIMVPVFAWGPGSEHFRGIMENTDLFVKMKTLFGVK